MTAVTEIDVKRAVDAIWDYLNLDDDRVGAAAELLRLSELEHLKLAIYPWQFRASKLSNTILRTLSLLNSYFFLFWVGPFSLYVILDIHCTRSVFCCISKYSHTELSIVWHCTADFGSHWFVTNLRSGAFRVRMLPVACTSLEQFLDTQREYESPTVVRVLRSSPLPALLPSNFSKHSAPFGRGKVVADRSWIARMSVRILQHTVVALSMYLEFLDSLIRRSWCLLFLLKKYESNITIYICPHFFYKNFVFYITKILLNFIKLQKHY